MLSGEQDFSVLAVWLALTWYLVIEILYLCLMFRLQLGLWELPQQDLDAGALDVRPRWPLTDRRDSRSMPAKKSMRKSRIFTSLTDLTAEALSSNQHHRATVASL